MPELEDALALFGRISRALTSMASAQWAHLDLTMAQLKVLFVLQEEGELPISVIADRLGGKLPAVSLLIDRLVQARLVRRSHDQVDRRRVLVELTPKAEQLTGRLRQGRPQMRQWLAKMSPEGRRALVRGLDELTTLIERHAHPRQRKAS